MRPSKLYGLPTLALYDASVKRIPGVVPREPATGARDVVRIRIPQNADARFGGEISEAESPPRCQEHPQPDGRHFYRRSGRPAGDAAITVQDLAKLREHKEDVIVLGWNAAATLCLDGGRPPGHGLEANARASQRAIFCVRHDGCFYAPRDWLAASGLPSSTRSPARRSADRHQALRRAQLRARR